MIRRTLFTTILTAVATVAVFGQTTTTTGPSIAQIVARRVAHLTTVLTLTSAQQATATTLFTTEFTDLASVRASLKTARTALKTAVQNNDAAGISTQATQIGTLTTQSVQAEATANAGFYASLTAAQQAIYNELKPGGGGPRGHGFGGQRH